MAGGLTKQVPEFFNAQQFEGGNGMDYGGVSSAYQQPGLGAMNTSLEQYRKQMLGLTPSVANAQLNQGMQMNNRAAMSLMGNARGGNLAGQGQAALNAMSGANAMTSQQAAINALAEQQAAANAYAGLGSQMSQFGLGYAGLGQGAYDTQQQRDLDWRLGKRGLDLQESQGNRQFWGGIAQAGIGAVGGMLGAAAGA